MISPYGHGTSKAPEVGGLETGASQTVTSTVSTPTADLRGFCISEPAAKTQPVFGQVCKVTGLNRAGIKGNGTRRRRESAHLKSVGWEARRKERWRLVGASDLITGFGPDVQSPDANRHPSFLFLPFWTFRN